jgi:hypothetical protein
MERHEKGCGRFGENRRKNKKNRQKDFGEICVNMNYY